MTAILLDHSSITCEKPTLINVVNLYSKFQSLKDYFIFVSYYIEIYDKHNTEFVSKMTLPEKLDIV